MTYRPYPDLLTTYVIVRTTGNGVVEDPYISHEAQEGSDDLLEATTKAGDLTRWNNSPEQLKSTWLSVRYLVEINTATEKGKELEEDFAKRFESQIEKIEYNPDYKKYEMEGGHVMYIQHNDALDGPRVTNLALIQQFMEKSPIHQLMVIESLCRFVKLILRDEDRTLLQMKNNLVSGEAWLRVAKEWAGISEARYDTNLYPKRVEDGKVVQKPKDKS